MVSTASQAIVRHLGLQDYRTTWQQMKAFTLQRDRETVDEIWVLQHAPVFTQGLNGKAEHVIAPADIPVVQTDRGGQVTYHGPGQLVIYVLMDLHRKGIGVKELVRRLEQSVVDVLADYSVKAYGREDAPGVYIGEAKIASLGLRVKRNRSYHGLSFNIDMDLEPFRRINPCGLRGIRVTQLRDWVKNADMGHVTDTLLHHLGNHLGYTDLVDMDDITTAETQTGC